MQSQTRLLVRHFVRGYLSNDLTGGERQAALSAALLISPGLFTTVLLAAKYVVTPFAVPGLSALGGFADRLLFFGASMVVVALVAVVQWDRLSLDARDGNVLGVLPLRHSQIVRAKWIATAVFASAATLMFNGLPSLIYPIVSVGRLEATWSLVVQLTLLQFSLAMLSGLIGFLVVLTIREVMWAVLGARTFARISAAVQATLVVLCILAFFLLPTHASRAVREGRSSVAWLPPVLLAGTFEELRGQRVASLPAPALHPRVASRAAGILAEYWDAFGHVRGSTRRTAVALSSLCLVLGAALLSNNRRRLEAPMLAARGTRVSRALVRFAWRLAAPRPDVRAGATFAWRTLLRSQPHRLRVAVGLAGGLAAGALVLLQEPSRGAPLPDTTLAVLSLQGLLAAAVAAGARAALRRSADSQASWIFTVVWNGTRGAYDTGVTLACWCIISVPGLLLVPLWSTMLGTGGAVRHAAVGMALALALAELVVLSVGTVALVDDAIPSGSARALPVLGLPIVTVAATVLAAAERASAVSTIGCLLVAAALLHAVRHRRSLGEQPPRMSVEPAAALGLNE
jgi:hypothetical protein